MTVGIIRVLTSEDPVQVDGHGRLLRERFGLRTDSRCIPGQPRGIHDEESERRAAPKIVDLARALERDGADTVLISCAADPALAATRAALAVPVIGAGTAAAGVALGLGTRVGVIGIRDEVPPAIAKVLGPHHAGHRRPEGVHDTVGLTTPEGAAAVLAAAAELVADGADTLLLACTGLTSIGIAPRLERELGVPAVDAVLAAGLLALRSSSPAAPPQLPRPRSVDGAVRE
ncbi:aspartate/glutamate racemase family protein [Streptomyces xiamenensis]|uniref:aspartate/glutamate racemase family protein n=1 Tax=Streptomyces xiamenensis TaxID=408015 RepID=UPI003D74FD9A